MAPIPSASLIGGFEQEFLKSVDDLMLHLRCLRVPVAHITPTRVVNDDRSTIGECFDRMGDIAWHDAHQARSGNLLHSVNGQFEFAFETSSCAWKCSCMEESRLKS